MSADPQSFVDGPALSPASAVLAWLDGEGKGQRVQLPFAVVVSPLGVESARLGAPPLADDALSVKLDDTALGVSLADQLGKLCGADGACDVWLEGVWGATVGGLDGPGMPLFGPAKPTFSVRAVGAVVPAGVTHVRVLAR